jgi:hypothetical protein
MTAELSEAGRRITGMAGHPANANAGAVVLAGVALVRAQQGWISRIPHRARTPAPTFA